MYQPNQLPRRETPEEPQRRMAIAQKAHDRADQSRAGLFPAVANFAVKSLKASALVNGGSAAAMLAFVGTGRQPVTADTILGLKAFGVGLIVSALATALAYHAQYFYLREMQTLRYDIFDPFVLDTPISRRANRAAVTFHIVGVGFVLAAFGCAAFGMLTVATSLVPLPPKT